MVNIKFSNEYGTISMSGGTHHDMKITTLSGFGIPQKEMNKVSFAGQPGITTTSSKDLQRTITIGGDFYGEASTVEKMLNVLYYKGVLECNFGYIKRQIACFLVGNGEFVKQYKSGIYKFALQFQADEPYFTDVHELKQTVMERKNKITGRFTLPAVFTERINKATITVVGDLPIYPIVKIKGLTDSLGEGQIIIKNETTGSTIAIDHKFVSGETITVDVPSRKIISDVNGVITNKMSDETVLSEFKLVKGVNCISCEKNNINDTFDELYAEVSYKNKYIAAVY